MAAKERSSSARALLGLLLVVLAAAPAAASRTPLPPLAAPAVSPIDELLTQLEADDLAGDVAASSAPEPEPTDPRFGLFDTPSSRSKTRVRAFDSGLAKQRLLLAAFRPEIVVGVPIYEWGPDRLLALNHEAEGRQFYLFDALGSVANLSKPDGTLQARFRWDAWGNLRSQAGSSFNLSGFTGHQRDNETGLYYAKARFYDPELGRFLSEDPAEGMTDTPPSLHRYVYAYDRPTVLFDPTGEATVQVGGYSFDVPDAAVQWANRQVGWAIGHVEGAQERIQAAVSLVRHPLPLLVLGVSQLERSMELDARLVQAFQQGGFEGLQREQSNVAAELRAAAKQNWPVVRLNADVERAFDAEVQGGGIAAGRAKARLQAHTAEDAVNVGLAFIGLRAAAARAPVMATEAAAAKETPALDVLAANEKVASQAISTVDSTRTPTVAVQRALPPGRVPIAALPATTEARPAVTFVAGPEGTLTADMQRGLAAARAAATAQGATPNSIGRAGEDLSTLTHEQGKPHVSYATAQGGRIVDRLLPRTNFEIKNTGRRQSNTAFYRRQVAKEQLILQADPSLQSVIIGTRGFSKAAADQAAKAGIKVIDLEKLPDPP